MLYTCVSSMNASNECLHFKIRSVKLLRMTYCEATSHPIVFFRFIKKVITAKTQHFVQIETDASWKISSDNSSAAKVWVRNGNINLTFCKLFPAHLHDRARVRLSRLINGTRQFGIREILNFCLENYEMDLTVNILHVLQICIRTEWGTFISSFSPALTFF